MPYSSEEILPSDILYVLENPWQISKDEWELQDNNDLERIFQYITKRLDLSKRDGFANIWRTNENNPIGILGCYRVEDKVYESFYFASKYMEEYAIMVTLDMRKILRKQASIYKDSKCILYSASNHPKQIAWFRLLGFKNVPEKNIDSARCFEFSSPA